MPERSKHKGEIQDQRRAVVYGSMSRCIWPSVSPRTLGATNPGAPSPDPDFFLTTSDGNFLLTSDGNNLVHGDG